MTAVLVHGHEVAIPEGWLRVESGEIQEGDRLAGITRFGGFKGWHSIEDRDDPSVNAADFFCVIRRDPTMKEQ